MRRLAQGAGRRGWGGWGGGVGVGWWVDLSVCVCVSGPCLTSPPSHAWCRSPHRGRSGAPAGSRRRRCPSRSLLDAASPSA